MDNNKFDNFEQLVSVFRKSPITLPFISTSKSETGVRSYYRAVM